MEFPINSGQGMFINSLLITDEVLIFPCSDLFYAFHLSLHEVKNRGDVDDFHIKWDIKDGFIKPEESWETHISQKTKDFCLNVIFPKNRRPLRIKVEESNSRKTHQLNKSNYSSLPDGRIKITWEKKNPRLYESYIIKWKW